MNQNSETVGIQAQQQAQATATAAAQEQQTQEAAAAATPPAQPSGSNAEPGAHLFVDKNGYVVPFGIGKVPFFQMMVRHFNSMSLPEQHLFISKWWKSPVKEEQEEGPFDVIDKLRESIAPMAPVEITDKSIFRGMYQPQFALNVVVRYFAQIPPMQQWTIMESFNRMLEENPEREKELGTLPKDFCNIHYEGDKEQEDDEDDKSSDSESPSLAECVEKSQYLDEDAKRILLSIAKWPHEIKCSDDICSYMDQKFDLGYELAALECLGSWFVRQPRDLQNAIVANYRLTELINSDFKFMTENE